MNKTTLLCATGAWLAMSSAMLSAQAQPDTPNAQLLREAESKTVGEYCGFARRILGDAAVAAAISADAERARASAALICNPLLTHFSLASLSGRSHAPWQGVARLNVNSFNDAQRGILDGMTEFRAIVREPTVDPLVKRALGEDATAFINVAETAHDLVSAMSRDRALQRLANYERKLGPTSARLNAPEVALNYLAQRFIKGFTPTPLGGPSPLEVVASYAPGYVTASSLKKATPVSVSEFGLRWYLFGEQFGKPGFKGLLFPTYWSVGVITASDRNGALVWPWRGSDRSGPYFAWGSLKVGYINRDGGSWLFTKQFQAIPLAF